jgi:hexosaminidase
MSKFSLCSLAAGLLAASALAQTPATNNLSQQQLDELGAHARFSFSLLGNFTRDADGLRARVQITNQSATALPAGAGNWRIYFHSVRNINGEDAGGLHLTHIQGDLYELAPKADFPGLAKGDSLQFAYGGGEWMVSYTDFMPRAFIAQPGLKPVVFSDTDNENLRAFVSPILSREQQLRYGAGSRQDLYPVATAASRFNENAPLASVKPGAEEIAQRIIPNPASVQNRSGKVTLDGTWKIRYAGRLTGEAAYLQEQLRAAGLRLDSQPDSVPATGKVIELKTGNLEMNQGSLAKAVSGEESYSLNIASDTISIQGSDNAGSFYGIQSLLGLLPAGQFAQVELPQLRIDDSPRYHWRGMHYDVGRNFHGKAVTLRLIEQMARHKLNKLHLHLTDDEGWRLQIPGLPELTDVGGARCFDLSEQSCLLTQLGTGPHTSGSGNGFYTSADFVEILKFAKARHIEVIPEIDMPGHARAAIKAMEARYKRLMAAGKKAEAGQYLLSDPLDKSVYASVQNYTDNAANVCLASTYAFVEKVVYELQQMYRTAGVKLAIYHMGGDEVGKGAWTESPACKALILKGEPGLAGVADFKPYFVAKVADITRARGLDLAGWEDGLMYDPATPFNRTQFSNENVYANAWDNIWEWGVADRAYRLANAGYKVILSPATHLYFDHPYEPNPEERGYYWATRYSDTAKVFGFMPDNYYANADRTSAGAPITNLEAMVGRELPPLRRPNNLVGMQGQVWSETIRTPEQLEQMIYPRLFALAERAWHKAAWESDKPDAAQRQRDWTVFAAALVQKELPKLAAAGASFYLPPPGAKREKDRLSVNTAYPGLPVEYSLDEGSSWRVYNGELSASGPLLLRSRLGDKASRPTAVGSDQN